MGEIDRNHIRSLRGLLDFFRQPAIAEIIVPPGHAIYKRTLKRRGVTDLSDIRRTRQEKMIPLGDKVLGKSKIDVINRGVELGRLFSFCVSQELRPGITVRYFRGDGMRFLDFES